MVGEISSSHLCYVHVSLHLVTGSDCHKIKQHSASAHWPMAREQKWVNLGWCTAALWGIKSDRQVEGHPVCPSHTWKLSRVSSGLSPNDLWLSRPQPTLGRALAQVTWGGTVDFGKGWGYISARTKDWVSTLFYLIKILLLCLQYMFCLEKAPENKEKLKNNWPPGDGFWVF